MLDQEFESLLPYEDPACDLPRNHAGLVAFQLGLIAAAVLLDRAANDWRYPLLATAFLPWLSPHALIAAAGPWALLVVCVIIFAETGLLIGFIFPGDTLLLITGLLTFGPHHQRLIDVDIWWVALAIGFSAFLGGEAGYFIGKKAGPRIFERKESGLFSIKNVHRTNMFFDKYGGFAVILARFVPIVRTFAPIAAGVGHMDRRKYTLYNLIGALVWGGGVTTAGYLLGNIPPVAHFVTKYVDVVLLGVVVVTAVVATIHYLRSASKARIANRAGVPAETGADVTPRATNTGADVPPRTTNVDQKHGD